MPLTRNQENIPKGEVGIQEAGGEINHQGGPVGGALVGRLRTDRDTKSEVMGTRVSGSTTD